MIQTTSSRLTVALVTDSGLFLPTLRAAHSALVEARSPLRMMIVGTSDLETWMWRAIKSLQRLHHSATIEAVSLPTDFLAEARSPQSFITPTALGRMFLPRLTGGRILYLDGDTLVTGDLSAASQLDMGGKPLAGVRDYAIMNWRSKTSLRQLDRQAQVLGWDINDLDGYINSGVLLMDADAIRAEPNLMDQMEDMRAAQGYPTVDQERINLLFRDRMTWLDPGWNCSWGRLRRQRRLQQGLSSSPQTSGPMILHFHGPNKPWHKLRLSSLSKGGMAILRYCGAMAQFHRDLPDIPQI